MGGINIKEIFFKNNTKFDDDAGKLQGNELWFVDANARIDGPPAVVNQFGLSQRPNETYIFYRKKFSVVKRVHNIILVLHNV